MNSMPLTQMKRLVVLPIDIMIRLWGKTVYVLYSLFGWRLVCLAGGLLGTLMYFTHNGKREITRSEIAALFGNRFNARQISDITRRSFLVYYKRQVETVFLGAMTRQRIDKVMRVEGRENLDEALARGKGVILLLSHFGSFLLPLPYLGHLGYRVNQITGKQQHVSLFAERLWLWRKREADRLPVGFLQVGRFLRPVFEALKNNEIVAVAFDGRDGAKWVEVDLFEKKALFSTGPFELARRTGAAIIPTFVIRDNHDIHKLVLEPPFDLSMDPDVEKALRLDTKRFADRFAEYIANCPCHFGMILYIMRKQQMDGKANPFYAET